MTTPTTTNLLKYADLQMASTPTGFSGTLFKSNKTGELVMSFRSTEFLDDNARDNMAINTQSGDCG